MDSKGGAELEEVRKRRIELEVEVKELQGRVKELTKEAKENVKALEKEQRRVEKLKNANDNMAVCLFLSSTTMTCTYIYIILKRNRILLLKHRTCQRGSKMNWPR